MRGRASVTVAAALLLAAGGVVPSAAGVPSRAFAVAEADQYSPLDLGTLGGDRATAIDINEHGEVLGTSDLPSGDRHAFYWSAATGMVDIGTLGGDNSFPVAINNQGVVVGNSELSIGTAQHAFAWTVDGGLIDLGTLGGPNSSAVAINDAGFVAGTSNRASGGSRPFIWSAGTGMQVIASLGTNGSSASAVALNEHNDVIGNWQMRATSASRAFVWSTSTGMVDLPVPAGPSRAAAMNNAREIVGNYGGTDVHPFIWSEEKGLTEVNNGLAATAIDINDDGWGAFGTDLFGTPGLLLWSAEAGAHNPQPAGSLITTTLNRHLQAVGGSGSVAQQIAFVWDPVDGATLLQGLGGPGSIARDVNDRGAIVGGADLVGGTTRHAVLWTIDTPVQVHWTAAEYARIQQLMAFYDMDYDELTKFGVYVAAFINAIDPSPSPTPITVDPPGTAQTQTITWTPDDITLLEAVKHRWVLDDEGAHRWGFMLLSFIAILQGA